MHERHTPYSVLTRTPARHPCGRDTSARKRRTLWNAVAASCLLAFAGASGAQTLGGTLNAQMMLTSGCVIYGSAGTTSGANFGVLDFGTRPGTFTGDVTSTATGGEGGPGTTQIVCSPEIASFTLVVGPGQHPGQGTVNGEGTRAMANGANFIPYDVFQDPAHLVPYVANAASSSIAITSAGLPIALPIYGRVRKSNPVALPAGLYTDQLQVTLSF